MESLAFIFLSSTLKTVFKEIDSNSSYNLSGKLFNFNTKNGEKPLKKRQHPDKTPSLSKQWPHNQTFKQIHIQRNFQKKSTKSWTPSVIFLLDAALESGIHSILSQILLRPAVKLHRVLSASAVGEKLLHPRIGGPVRPAAGRRGGHAAAPRRSTKRSHAAEAVMGSWGGLGDGDRGRGS